MSQSQGVRSDAAQFVARAAVEPVRNCTQVPRATLDGIVSKVAQRLLESRCVLMIRGKEWNAGGGFRL